MGELDVERARPDAGLGGGQRGAGRPHFGGQLVDIGLRDGLSFQQPPGAAEVGLGEGQFAWAEATLARASARAAVKGRGSMVNSSWPCRTIAPSVKWTADDLARNARAHLDAAARLEAADIIVPLVDLALEGCRDRHHGGRGAAAGEGSLLQKVTAAASRTSGEPMIAARCQSGAPGNLSAKRH